MRLIGPFSQLLTLRHLPMKGALRDEALEVVEQGGVLLQQGRILDVGPFEQLRQQYPHAELEAVVRPSVLLPGFVDCHTHICFGGSRRADYALRNQGVSYLEIARQGGGIWHTVAETRRLSRDELAASLAQRANRHLSEGVTTIEVKSGYGLSVAEELKQLRAIRQAQVLTHAELLPTCLAAHMPPKDFEGTPQQYLEQLLAQLLPAVQAEDLAHRVDIFVEDTAFSGPQAMEYLLRARMLGFDITVHADQFHTGGSRLALEVGARSADHLEASGEQEIRMLAASDTVAVALPGASLGLGMPMAPARALLDAGASLAIASDWNPGSAPMGDLLLQAALLGAQQKLSAAEVFSALTFRAAKALALNDRGRLQSGMLADLQAYPTDDYRDILYMQGKMKPYAVWKDGMREI